MVRPHCSSVSKDVILISLSLIVCFLCVDSFLYPLIPNVRQYAHSSPPFNSGAWNLDGSLQGGRSADHEDAAVMYRNALWKPEIGDWLSQCGTPPLVSISERFHSKKCDNECSRHGVCNHELGECRCFHGYSGKGCQLLEEFPCSVPEIYWRPSACVATCDTRKAFCYCGEGTKYPQRSVAGPCGYVLRDGLVDYKTPDPQIFSNSSSEVGWCNVDPDDFTSVWKDECPCPYDGTSGRLCELTVESVCINQCSGNGQCRGGFCDCVEGWYGIDCSTPSRSSLQSRSLDTWPTWLQGSTQGSTVNIALSDSQEGKTLEVTVEKTRPLIYVYDLPAELNSHLLEGRISRVWCSTRLYDNLNNTIWIPDLYGSEPSLLEILLASPHRTTNPDEADFFYVPTFDACARFQADESPRRDMQKEHLGLRGYYSGAFHKRAYEHIRETYPYWNRSSGRDHLWLFAWDEGACSAPKEIWNSIMLVHWGNTHSKHDYSTSAWPPDRWTHIPTEFRGNHPCYDPSKDIVLPAWKTPDPTIMKQKLWARPLSERPTFFYFNGNLGKLSTELPRPEKEYSMGLRQKLAEEFGSAPNKLGQIGRQSAPDMTVTSVRSQNYALELSQSRFCGVFPGDGWSGRLEDSILHGCIPVIVQDGIHLPFENVLDYNAFAVRIPENELANMVHILRGINETRVDSMLSAVQGMWERFTYHNAVKLEAGRQELLNKSESEWATEYNNLTGDDAFTTLMQVLRFKLSNGLQKISSTETRDRCKNRSSAGVQSGK